MYYYILWVTIKLLSYYGAPRLLLIMRMTTVIRQHGFNAIRMLRNKMNPEYFSLEATALKPQQIPMFLHISARVWGRR